MNHATRSSLLAKMEISDACVEDQDAVAGAYADFENDPSDLTRTNALIQLLVANGATIPDDLHEKLLRAQLLHYPHRMDLTKSLVGLLFRAGRAPLPGLSSDAAPSHTLAELDGLADAANETGDNLELFAALWQQTIQYPGDAHGWARLAQAFAERRNWNPAKTALAEAMRRQPAEEGSIRRMLRALNIVAEQEQLRGFEWREWFDGLPPQLRQDPNGVGLLLHSARDDALQLVPEMLARHADDPKALLVAAIADFARRNFEEAYAHLRAAFERDPREALVQVITNYSAQVSTILRSTGKADEFAEWLTERTSGLREVSLLPVNSAPEGMLIARRLRNTACDRGLPSAMLISQGKAGSTSVANIFNSGFGLPALAYCLFNLRVVRPWLAEYLEGGVCYCTHLRPEPVNIALFREAGLKRAIVHVRDPRQIIVSLMEHYRRYPSQATQLQNHNFSRGDEETLEYVIQEFLGNNIWWIDGWRSARASIDVVFTTYEEFVLRRNDFVERLLAAYGGDVGYFDRTAAFTEAPGNDYHRRQGQIDEWRQRLSARQIERINRAMPDHLWKEFGWTP